MTDKGNVFRLREDGWGMLGAGGARRDGFLVGRQGNPRCQLLGYVPHPTDSSLPRTRDGILFEGAVAQQKGGARVVTGRGNWGGALLSVSTLELSFAPEGSSYFGAIEVEWFGVECIGGVFVQVGERTCSEQHQLVALDVGKFVVIGDHNRRFMKVWCDEDVLHGGPATREDLALVLVRRLEFMPNATYQMMRRTRQALKGLELPHLWTDALAERMHRINPRCRR